MNCSADHLSLALNKDLFPLGTDTYPHTRGIRVEIAGIVVICLMGVISQMKMWKIVRDRRQRKAAERLERERDAEEAEAAIGRKIEDENVRERQEWEAAYGDRRSSEAKARDATSEDDDDAGSVRKHSVGAIELRELPKVNVEGLYDPIDIDRISFTGRAASEAHNDTSQEDEAKQTEQETARLSVPPAPPVIPLPFTIPSISDPDAVRATSSVSARAETEQELVNAGEPLKTSGSKRLSPGAGIPVTSPSEEALLEPSIEDDVASSVAATVDDLSDIDSDISDDAQRLAATKSPHTELVLLIEDDTEGKRPLVNNKAPELIELPPSPLEAVSGYSTGQNSNPFDEHFASLGKPATTKVRGDASASPSNSSIAGDRTDPALVRGTAKQRKSGKRKSKRGPEAENAEADEQRSSLEGSAQAESTTSDSDSDASASPSATAAKLSRRSLKEHLPQRVSKVLLRYRTNEWAKHVSVAEQPELEPLEPTEDGVSLVDASVESSSQRGGRASHSHGPGHTEVSGPDKQSGEPTPGQSTSSLSSDSQHVAEKNQGLRKSSSAQSLQQYINRSRAGSLASLEGGGSAASAAASVRSIPQSIAAATRAIRSSSSPMPNGSTLSLSNPRLYGYRTISQPTSSSNLPNTLISQRENLIQNRFGPRSSTQLTPVLELDNPLHPNDSISIYGSRESTVGDDTASLRQRAESIKGLPSQQWQRYPSPGPNQISNLHLPKRHSDLEVGKRDAMMMHWRESLRQHSIHSQPPRPMPDARGEELHQDRQQRLSVTRQKPDPRAQYDTMLDERMRKSDMLELHRTAIRKMQAVANAHA